MGRAVHTFGAVTTDMARRVPQKHGGVLTIAEKGDVLNKRGRPRLTTTINKELEAEGVSPVGRKEIMDIIARLQNLLGQAVGLDKPCLHRHPPGGLFAAHALGRT